MINNHDGSTDTTVGKSVLKFDATAKYYDRDGSGDYNENDEVILDVGGSGTYSASGYKNCWHKPGRWDYYYTN